MPPSSGADAFDFDVVVSAAAMSAFPLAMRSRTVALRRDIRRQRGRVRPSSAGELPLENKTVPKSCSASPRRRPAASNSDPHIVSRVMTVVIVIGYFRR